MIAVIGAGPAGLATAYYLQQAGLPYVVYEKATIAQAWKSHYQSLHLHTLKEVSALPGRPFPPETPTFPSRQQVVDYLEEYARHFKLNIQEGVELLSAQYHAYHKGWHLKTNQGEKEAHILVVATGIWSTPHRPEFAQERLFQGQILHANQYQTPQPFVGQRVLVVGGGNTGAELATELAQAGCEVSVLISEGTVFVPYPTSAGAMKAGAWLFRHLPAGLGNVLLQRARRRFDHLGLTWPNKPLVEAYPVVGFELPELIAAGKIKLFTQPIQQFTPSGVQLADGQTAAFDTVILATGYRPTLHFLGSEIERDKQQRPVLNGWQSTRNPHLFCVGFSYPATEGWLQALPRVAQEVVQQIQKGKNKNQPVT